ncbi:unnamed protein product, partial [Phaeothamnion confervicola]
VEAITEDWLPPEDAALARAVERYGESWDVAAFIVNCAPAVPGRLRSGMQCRERHAELVAQGRAGPVGAGAAAARAAAAVAGIAAAVSPLSPSLADDPMME